MMSRAHFKEGFGFKLMAASIGVGKGGGGGGGGGGECPHFRTEYSKLANYHCRNCVLSNCHQKFLCIVALFVLPYPQIFPTILSPSFLHPWPPPMNSCFTSSSHRGDMQFWRCGPFWL